MVLLIQKGGTLLSCPCQYTPPRRPPFSPALSWGDCKRPIWPPPPPPVAGHHLSLPPISLTAVAQGYVCGRGRQRVLSHQNKPKVTGERVVWNDEGGVTKWHHILLGLAKGKGGVGNKFSRKRRTKGDGQGSVTTQQPYHLPQKVGWQPAIEIR